MSNERMAQQPEPTVVTTESQRAAPGDAVAQVPWGWGEIGKTVLLILLGTIGVTLLLVGVLVATGNTATAPTNMASTPLFVLGIAIYLVVILGVYLYAVRRSAGGWQTLGWRSFAGSWLLALPLLTLVQLVGMALINVVFVLPFVGSDFENPQIEAITGGGMLSLRDLVLLMILIAVVAPLAEEIFFRGMLYPVLRRRWSVAPAIVINGLLFSLIHLIPPLLPGLFFVGMVLAWVRERSGSLIPCILLHAMQNGVVLLGIYSMASGLGG